MNREDTIAALATPPGIGALGIIRVSGSGSHEQVGRIFKNPGKKRIKEMKGYTAAYGHIVEPGSGSVADEVVVLVMHAPNSYTGENMVEIIGHGGPVPLKSILDLLLDGGVRLAEPGEFTRRAFFNGKMDLAQAEAVVDVIEAKTKQGLRLALDHLGGSLSRFIRESSDRLWEVLAYCEASIDFPEDELDGMSLEDVASYLNQVESDLEEALATYSRGRALREGVRTTIIGRPNVGKSTLLNALLGEERALVTSVPGTTRDSVEEIINLDGIPLRLIDTAGLRETEDEVEKLGVDRTLKLLERSDLILAVLDSTTGFTVEDEKMLATIPPEKSLVIVNKIDLEEKIDLSRVKGHFPEEEILFISAREGQGLGNVREAIRKRIIGTADKEGIWVSNLRHERALKDALKSVKAAREGWQQGITMDLVVVDIRGALHHLGQITGETISQDISREIFSRFCIGK